MGFPSDPVVPSAQRLCPVHTTADPCKARAATLHRHTHGLFAKRVQSNSNRQRGEVGGGGAGDTGVAPPPPTRTYSDNAFGQQARPVLLFFSFFFLQSKKRATPCTAGRCTRSLFACRTPSHNNPPSFPSPPSFSAPVSHVVPGWDAGIAWHVGAAAGGFCKTGLSSLGSSPALAGMRWLLGGERGIWGSFWVAAGAWRSAPRGRRRRPDPGFLGQTSRFLLASWKSSRWVGEARRRAACLWRCSARRNVGIRKNEGMR